MAARIYRPAKSAMSSGRGRTQDWVLEFDPESPKAIEPLMGYTATTDMRSQIRLRFGSKEEAIAYAEREGLDYRVSEAHERRRANVAYADNFSPKRATPWTH